MSATLVAALAQMVPGLVRLAERAFTGPKSGPQKRDSVIQTLLPAVSNLVDDETPLADVLNGIGQIVDGTVQVMNAVNALRSGD